MRACGARVFPFVGQERSLPWAQGYSSDALSEIESFCTRSHKVIIALTVQEILNEQIAKKLV